MDAILPLKRSNSRHRFLNWSNHLDRIVYNASIFVSEDPHIISPTLKRLCTKTSEIQRGRWVRVPRTSSHCPPDVCVGSQKGIDWITDKFNFNERFVWSPIDCNLRLFTAEDVGTCFKRKNYSSVAFTGDSLVREHFQNLLALALPSQSIKLEKLKEDSASVVVQLPNGYSTRIDYYVIPRQWNRKSRNIPHPVDVKSFSLHLFCVHALRLQASCAADASLAATISSWFDSTWSRIRPSSSSGKDTTRGTSGRVFYFQAEDIRVQRLALRSGAAQNVSSIACMTVERHRVVREALLARLQSLSSHNTSAGRGKLPAAADLELFERYVDGWTLTQARWEASWDGIHYSLLLNERTFPAYASSNTGTNWTCSSGSFLQGGRSLCKLPVDGWLPVKEIPGINRCMYDIDNGSGPMNGVVEERKAMYWCRDVIALSKNFHFFEGGVSRMLTNFMLNLACNQ
jgi:hypothetical protein